MMAKTSRAAYMRAWRRKRQADAQFEREYTACPRAYGPQSLMPYLIECAKRGGIVDRGHRVAAARGC